ncbi:MAG: TolC family protein, partial [Bacteroidetes bacterium]|nr:TolC family protein [Bacteroidota bacterium]
MKRYITVAVLMAGFFFTSFCQERLTLDDAISIALENNYGILVARNDAQISANNAHPGAAGLLPTVSGNAGANYNNNNVQVEFATAAIPSVDESGVVSSSMNAGINLNYTVFDGLGNVNTFRVLKKSAQLSEAQVQAVIEATISQVGIAYYAIARLTENYQTLQESAEISQERLSRANNQKAFGTAGKLVVLNAEVDLNSDSSNIAVASFSLENAKRNLNALIGRDVNSDFSVDTEVSFARNLNLNNLMATAQKNNVTLRQAEYLQQIAELNLRIAKANYMPVLGVSAGYNYSRAENGPG